MYGRPPIVDCDIYPGAIIHDLLYQIFLDKLYTTLSNVKCAPHLVRNLAKILKDSDH